MAKTAEKINKCKAFYDIHSVHGKESTSSSMLHVFVYLSLGVVEIFRGPEALHMVKFRDHKINVVPEALF